MKIVWSFLCVLGSAWALQNVGTGSENGLGRAIGLVWDQCDNSLDIFKCLKIQGAKLAARALKVQNIKLVDGVSIVRKSDFAETGRSINDMQLSNSDLEKMSAKSLNQVLLDRLRALVQSRQIQVSIPKLLSFGQKNAESLIEGRKKKDDKKYLAPFIATVLLKAGILKMAYHSIAIVAGKALIVGKIALIISAIIGLKKLVSQESHEKTTYEIVKHPHIQQSHTYSSSHGEYDGHESSGGSYHRSIGEEEMMMQDKAYRAYMQGPNAPRT